MRFILSTLIAVAALVGLYGASLRFAVESKNRVVEVAVDMAEIQKLSVAEGKTIGTVLNAFKAAGVTSVAITEDTISSLEESRRIEVVSTPSRGTTYMMIHQGNYARLVAALRNRTNLGGMFSIPPSMENRGSSMDAGIDLNYPYNLVHHIGLGLDPELVAAVHACHLNVIGRVENNENTPEAGIGWTLDQLKAQAVSTVIFSGEEILGYDGHLKATEKALRDRKMNFGIVEFGKIKGDDQLHRLLPDQTVRVHTVTGGEMASATPGDNIQRFSLAARERNIRLLFVRLFLSKTNPLAENTKYLEKLTQTLKQGDLSLGAAHPYEDLTVPIWARLVIGLGIGAAFLLLLDTLCGLLSTPMTLLTRISVVVGILLTLLAVLPIGGHLPARLAALAAACLFPSLALSERSLLQPLPWGDSLWTALAKRVVGVLSVTGVGMCCIVGLLADRDFLVKADAFLGIKVALYLPLLVATVVWGLGLRAETPTAWKETLHRQVRRAQALLQDPLRLWQVLAGVGVLAVLVMLWLRSGNEGTAVVSGVELKFRDLLDRYLFVRPRLKANLFAALLLGVYFAARGKHGLALPFFLLGIIAVTDFLNTFCHLHTPLLVSALRDILGLVIGLGMGVVVIVLLERRRSPEEEAIG